MINISRNITFTIECPFLDKAQTYWAVLWNDNHSASDSTPTSNSVDLTHVKEDGTTGLVYFTITPDKFSKFDAGEVINITLYNDSKTMVYPFKRAYKVCEDRVPSSQSSSENDSTLLVRIFVVKKSDITKASPYYRNSSSDVLMSTPKLYAWKNGEEVAYTKVETPNAETDSVVWSSTGAKYGWIKPDRIFVQSNQDAQPVAYMYEGVYYVDGGDNMYKWGNVDGGSVYTDKRTPLVGDRTLTSLGIAEAPFKEVKAVVKYNNA